MFITLYFTRLGILLAASLRDTWIKAFKCLITDYRATQFRRLPLHHSFNYGLQGYTSQYQSWYIADCLITDYTATQFSILLFHHGLNWLQGYTIQYQSWYIADCLITDNRVHNSAAPCSILILTPDRGVTQFNSELVHCWLFHYWLRGYTSQQHCWLFDDWLQGYPIQQKSW